MFYSLKFYADVSFLQVINKYVSNMCFELLLSPVRYLDSWFVDRVDLVDWGGDQKK